MTRMDSNIFETHGGVKSAADRSGGFAGPRIVLHRPQIPQNTGNISRLCVAIQSPLVITGRAGFDFDAAAVRRAGLDHWEHLQFTHYKRFRDFCAAHKAARLIAVSKAGTTSALEFAYEPGDILLFGNETMGLPPALMRRLTHSVYLPMSGPVRSLNLSNSVAIVAYEYIRTVHGNAAQHRHDNYPRTYYK
jgi:tRNA (cytidine/uridine-2'-O-)-methyltransferase